MRKLLLFTVATLMLSAAVTAQPSEKAAENVIKRVTGQKSMPVKYKIEPSADSATYFDYKVSDGVLNVVGSSPVALCRGVYDYAKGQGFGINSWSGSNLKFPTQLKGNDSSKVVSPFQHHYYLNVVTFGYTMPYWDWKRWEKEIDWAAVHGIDMPLAIIAYEAIMERVLTKMGLTSEEVNNYFSAPAHLPWLRMGNISSIDAPLNANWHKRQINLQHKVLKRMRELGMTPICPGFPGFVPEAIKRVHPEVNLLKVTWSDGAFSNNMISPEEPLFSEISTAFIREWEKEFGKCSHYLVDSFNEMEVPFPPKGEQARYDMAAMYGEKVYNSIKAGNPDAVWTMQGWMFGYQPHIWDPKTLSALISRIPNNKMLLLDLAVDYNKHFWKSPMNWELFSGFFGKQWVYSVIPNMGGKTAQTGVLDFYANGHLEALNSKNKGNLVAFGFAPEGIENNEIIYELLSDAGWGADSIDVKEWYKNYTYNRYGFYNKELGTYMDKMLLSVYGTFTDHPRFNWQLRPGSTKNGTVNISEGMFEGIESFVKSSRNSANDLYKADLAELTALYVGGKAERILHKIWKSNDKAEKETFEVLFIEALTDIDNILQLHPTLRLDIWVDNAKACGVDAKQRNQYAVNAKRLVTIWGPPVDDYSARVWSGLISEYYIPRWKNYFESTKKGEKFDFAKWEKNWVETAQIPAANSEGSIMLIAPQLIYKYKRF